MITNQSEFEKVNAKILRKIVKDIKHIFKDDGGLSSRDEKIIRENYKYQQSSWDSLGYGIRLIIERIIAPITMSIYENEIKQAILKDADNTQNKET